LLYHSSNNLFELLTFWFCLLAKSSLLVSTPLPLKPRTTQQGVTVTLTAVLTSTGNQNQHTKEKQSCWRMHGTSELLAQEHPAVTAPSPSLALLPNWLLTASGLAQSLDLRKSRESA
jgi:hypothetical protein